MLKRLFLVCVTFGVALAIYSFGIEPRRLAVRTIALETTGPPLRVGLMADLHVGGLHVPTGRVAQVVDAMNANNPDIVLLAGDFINGHTKREALAPPKREEIDASLAELARLEAPAFAVLGSHDAWHGAEAVLEQLEAAGVVVLGNAGTQIQSICIVGFEDIDVGSPDVSGYDACEAGDSIFAMMHSPDTRHLLRSDTTLAVAGHTHGGQVVPPLLGRIVTMTECGKPCGYGFTPDAVPLYVTSGIGTSILPVRFRSVPEIVLFELTPPAPAPRGPSPT